MILALVFAFEFGGPAILKSYIEIGIGRCEKLPILCKAPEEKWVDPALDMRALSNFVTYSLDEITIEVPRIFTVIKEHMRKAYYKKKHKDKGDVIYLLYQKPGFFLNLFPKLKKKGLTDDYEFFNRTMSAQTFQIQNMTDTFFVIMKSIFVPNLGEQKNVRMIIFQSGDKKGFLNYSLGDTGNYFDCNVFNAQQDFFKIYIVDKSMTLDLNKVFTIISTVRKTPGS
ncbi:hypothetical protein LDC_1894 [sediment metagenome]|uniref:Uncharacterized protein n=1 Tax=sediment metagenome TaxID=749907 RepID=D9PK29_9ZZZZ